MRRYERTVTVEDRGDGTALVTNDLDFAVGFPFWAWVFARPMAVNLSRVRWVAKPWWLPPDQLDVRAATALASLAALAVFTGGGGVLLSQTLTFAADEFGSRARDQGFALAAARADVVVALALLAAADRKGRRWALLVAAVVTCIATGAGALSPSLWALAGTQVVARGAGAALGILIGIVAAEEMPKSSRAYAVGILALAGGMGAGLPILLLFVADLAPWGWRLLYGMMVLALPAVWLIAPHLPESRRFARPHDEHTGVVRQHGRRFWVLAASTFLFAMFLTPASQFVNEYLREERHFSAGRITLFTVLTNMPGFLGIVIGGRLAERGRRAVGAVAVLVGSGSTVAMFLTQGWPIWAWSVLGATVGAASIPALGVYGPELFPTASRGRANGLLAGVGRGGSVLGLILCGFLVDRLDTFGPAMAVLGIAPLLVAVLVLTAYPETAHLELEELNPEDAPPTR